MGLWDEILGAIEQEVSCQNVGIWFRPTSMIREEEPERKLLVRVPNRHFKCWLEERVSDLKARDDSGRVAKPRQPDMFLCRELTNNSLLQIGKQLGGKHHTTVLHSVRNIENLRKSDSSFDSTMTSIIEGIR